MPVAMPGAILLIVAALLGLAGSEKPDDSNTGNIFLKTSLMGVLIIENAG